jgi:tRNA (guanine-N7-)-methyltransferase
MHGGGRLSFRRRVREVADDGTLPFVMGGEDPPPLPALVRGSPAGIEVEVGPGKGAFLLAAARARPDTFVLGIEASAAYAKFAAERVRDAGLENAVLLVDNARLYLEDRVPQGALRAVHVYYPDPWPKRRHRKRRFFVAETPAVLHRCLAPGGCALIATDNAAYAGQIVALMGASPLFVRDRTEEARLRAAPPGHGFSPTNFERKYLQEGRTLRRYAFRKPTA